MGLYVDVFWTREPCARVLYVMLNVPVPTFDETRKTYPPIRRSRYVSVDPDVCEVE